jgi:hypothetical protein
MSSFRWGEIKNEGLSPRFVVHLKLQVVHTVRNVIL